MFLASKHIAKSSVVARYCLRLIAFVTPSTMEYYEYSILAIEAVTSNTTCIAS